MEDVVYIYIPEWYTDEVTCTKNLISTDEQLSFTFILCTHKYMPCKH